MASLTKEKTRASLQQRAFSGCFRLRWMASSYAQGFGVTRRRDQLRRDQAGGRIRCPAAAGKLRSAGGCGIRIANFEWRLCRRLKPDFPLWRIRRQNVKGFAHVPGRTEEALLRWLSVNSSQSLGKSAESQTSGMVSDRGSPKMVVALSKATPCGWNFSAAR